GRRVTAAQVLLVDRLRGAAGGSGRPLFWGDENRVNLLFFGSRRLMAIKAVDALGTVRAELVFVHHRVLLLQVTLGTLAGRTHQCRSGLIRLDAGPRAIDGKSGDDH